MGENAARRLAAQRRVYAFLERRAVMRGIDPERIVGLDGDEGPQLLVSDLALLTDPQLEADIEAGAALNSNLREENERLRSALEAIASQPALAREIASRALLADKPAMHVHKPEYPSRCTGCEHMGWNAAHSDTEAERHG